MRGRQAQVRGWADPSPGPETCSYKQELTAFAVDNARRPGALSQLVRALPVPGRALVLAVCVVCGSFCCWSMLGDGDQLL